jgi:hypothetical protein
MVIRRYKRARRQVTRMARFSLAEKSEGNNPVRRFQGMMLHLRAVGSEYSSLVCCSAGTVFDLRDLIRSAPDDETN